MQVNGNNNFITPGTPVEATLNLQTLSGEDNGVRYVSDGEIISGVVVECSDGEVSVDLGNNCVVNARCDAALNLISGTNVSMLVSTLPGNNIALKPLFTNMAQEKLAGRAIADANLPLDDISMKLVSDLLSEGMSIDKDSLNSMYRQIISNSDVSPALIVRMNKLGMEVTPSNVQSFNALDNFSDKISDTVRNITEMIPDEISEMCSQGKSDEAVTLFKECLAVITESENTVVSNTADMEEITVVPGRNGEEAAVMQTETETVINVFQEVESADGGIKTANIEEQVMTYEPDGKEPQVVETRSDNTGNVTVIDNSDGNGSLSVPREIKAEFAELCDKAAQGNISSEDIVHFLSDKDGKDLFTKSLSDAFAIKPQNFSDKNEVREFYSSLCDRVKNISQRLLSALPGNESLSAQITDFARNVDFVDQINRFVSYIQLPIKMGNDSRTGDLCVYANKKNLSEPSDNISALLRLDMKYLGYTEVYVKLSESKVSTNFRLENEDSLDLIQSHIGELTERLEAKGYNLDVKTMLVDSNEPLSKAMASGIDATGVTPQGMPSGDIIYRFDARA